MSLRTGSPLSAVCEGRRGRGGCAHRHRRETAPIVVNSLQSGAKAARQKSQGKTGMRIPPPPPCPPFVHCGPARRLRLPPYACWIRASLPVPSAREQPPFRRSYATVQTIAIHFTKNVGILSLLKPCAHRVALSLRHTTLSLPCQAAADGRRTAASTAAASVQCAPPFLCRHVVSGGVAHVETSTSDI